MRNKSSRRQQLQQRMIDWLLDLDAEDVALAFVFLVAVAVCAGAVYYGWTTPAVQEYRVYIPST